MTDRASARSSAARPGFSFFLHAHIPWVIRHGRWPHGVEWLFEAAFATYLPLVVMARRLRDRGIGGGLTISISPILAEQLAHPLFREGLREWLDACTTTAAQESERFEREGNAAIAQLARRWEAKYRDASRLFFDELQGDLLGAFADLARSGTIELATCGATHGYFPLLGRDETIALQVVLARRTHTMHFGAEPAGMWLPEAAYRPSGWWRSPADGSRTMRAGVEEFLEREGIRYVILDSALLTGGRTIGAYLDRGARVAAPRDAPGGSARDSGAPPPALDTRAAFWMARAGDAVPHVAAFVRDPDTAQQVWSRELGYPGDPAYLEFHKKSDGGGHRYWRITGTKVDLQDKALHDPDAASQRVRVHAEHFASLVRTTLAGAGASGILAAPFDAELFGHWWAEGVEWLEEVLVRLHGEPSVRATSLAEHLDRFPPQRIVRFPEGSWGAGGRHDVWASPQLEWAWRSIHRAEDEVWSLVERARRSPHASARRVARAALRQLLLLVASDWPFLISTGGAPDYATQRLEEHADAVFRLTDLGRRALRGAVLEEREAAYLDSVEARDDPFPHLGDAVSLGEPPRAFAAQDSLEERSFRREEREDRFPRARRAIP